jgi:hypothetical protein
MIRALSYWRWRLWLHWTAHAQPAFVRYYQRKIAAAKRQHKKTSHILAELQAKRHEAMRKEIGR